MSKNIIISLSKKEDGPMSYPGFLDGKMENQEINENRRKFFKKIGIDSKSVVSAGSLHKSNLKTANKCNCGKILADTDGLLSNEEGLFLALTVSDCLPVYLHDSKNGAFGLLHCGWRGIVADILEKGIEVMEKEFQSAPGNVEVEVGPGIGKCHFKVGPEVSEKFHSTEEFLDLKGEVKARLLKLGVSAKNIKISPKCTFCLENEYFSFRRDKPENPQNMVAIIGRKS